ncbi:AMIN-like domain-containing (lipo)protein [Actinokineospora sp. HUAS TT18]|uniref:AMIN-like domain-containing (lipo)protein n=1 Tax=Actinokineospora sp. HUAS TT18 TaxID=3447451 RepID=UPI003F51F6DB
MTASLTGIRVGRHETYDRVVLDFTGTAPTFTHEATDELVVDPSGEVDWLTGCTFVQVNAHGATAHNDAGESTYPGPRKFRTRELANVMAVSLNSDFEGVVGVGIGLRHTAPVTVFTLTSPTRLVIDIQH